MTQYLVRSTHHARDVFWCCIMCNIYCLLLVYCWWFSKNRARSSVTSLSLLRYVRSSNDEQFLHVASRRGSSSRLCDGVWSHNDTFLGCRESWLYRPLHIRTLGGEIPPMCLVTRLHHSSMHLFACSTGLSVDRLQQRGSVGWELPSGNCRWALTSRRLSLLHVESKL